MTGANGLRCWRALKPQIFILSFVNKWMGTAFLNISENRLLHVATHLFTKSVSCRSAKFTIGNFESMVYLKKFTHKKCCLPQKVSDNTECRMTESRIIGTLLCVHFIVLLLMSVYWQFSGQFSRWIVTLMLNMKRIHCRPLTLKLNHM